MPRLSDDGRWAWDYGSGRWIPANKIGDTEGLKKLGLENVVVEPGTSASELRVEAGNATLLKLLAFTTALLLPGLDYSILGLMKPRKSRNVLLGIGIFLLFSISLGTAICAPLAVVIWIHGIVTVANRANSRIHELGFFSNDIFGKKIQR